MHSSHACGRKEVVAIMKNDDLLRPVWDIPTWRSRAMAARGAMPYSVFRVWDVDGPPDRPNHIRVELDGRRWPEWLNKDLFVVAI